MVSYKQWTPEGDALSILPAEAQAFTIQCTTALFDDAKSIDSLVNDEIISTQWRVLGQLDGYVDFMLPLHERKPIALSTDQRIVANIQTTAQKARLYMDLYEHRKESSSV